MKKSNTTFPSLKRSWGMCKLTQNVNICHPPQGQKWYQWPFGEDFKYQEFFLKRLKWWITCTPNLSRTFLPHRFLSGNGIWRWAVWCLHTPKDVHVLNPGTRESVTLPGKWDFANVIKVIDPEMGRKPWIIRWTPCITRFPIRGKQKKICW